MDCRNRRQVSTFAHTDTTATPLNIISKPTVQPRENLGGPKDFPFPQSSQVQKQPSECFGSSPARNISLRFASSGVLLNRPTRMLSGGSALSNNLLSLRHL